MLSENNPEDDINGKSVNLFAKGKEFDASSENSIMKLLWNNLIGIENDSDDNFIEEIVANGITYHFDYYMITPSFFVFYSNLFT